MTRRRVWPALVCAVALACIFWADVEIQAVNFFTSNCDGAAYPLCGFASEDTTNYGTYVNRTRVTDGCPDGTDAVHFEMIPVGSHVQFNYGWATGPLSGWNPANGDTFYLKYRVRPNSSITWTGNTPEPVFYQKFIIFNADIDSQRFITDFRDNGGNDNAAMRSQLNVGGGPNAALSLGSWNAVIQGYTLASTQSANDGLLRTWVATGGTFSFGSPTSTNSALDLEDNVGRTGFEMGRFTQTTLGSGGSFGYDICNVVLTDTFDANWPVVNKTYYVSKLGSDSNTCTQAESTTEASQKLTIAGGIGCLSAGDTLFIHTGTYEEVITEATFASGGTSWTSPIKVAAYPAETVIVKPTGGTGNVVSFPTGNRSYIIFERLIFDGENAGGDGGAAVVYLEAATDHLRFDRTHMRNGAGNGVLAVLGSTDHEFLDCEAYRNGLYSAYTISNGLYLEGANTLVRGGRFYNNEAFGIRLYASAGTSSNNIIERTRAYNNGKGIGLDGTSVSAADGGGIVVADSNQIVRNNLVYDNYHGILGYTDSDGVEILNNTVYSNSFDGLAMQFYITFPTLRNNITYLNSTNFVDYSGMNGLHSSNLSGTDPLFTDAGAFDFSLQSGSPALNIGVTLGNVLDDFIATSRPQGAGYDVGAYERIVAGGSPTRPRLRFRNPGD